MPRPDNEIELLDLMNLLSGGRFMTAAQIAVETGCAKTTSYKRLRQISKRLRQMSKRFGIRLVHRKTREGVSGPKSTAYALQH